MWLKEKSEVWDERRIHFETLCSSGKTGDKENGVKRRESKNEKRVIKWCWRGEKERHILSFLITN